MRVLLIWFVAALPVIAQSPVVRLTNATRPGSNEFQIGDQYEIVITGAASQPVSVRTTTKGAMDWGPVTGWTDLSGRWSTTGRIEKGDLGGWSAVWTVGGKLAIPAIHLLVIAPCLKGGWGQAGGSGPNMFVTCDTAEGRQSFVTRSDTDPFRTPDGRLVPGRVLTNQSPQQYHAEIIQYFMTSGGKEIGVGPLGDEAGDSILKMIGVNALSDDEVRNVLLIVRSAFAKPESIEQAAKDPSRTLLLLRKLSDLTDQERLKQQIVETMAYVRAQ